MVSYPNDPPGNGMLASLASLIEEVEAVGKWHLGGLAVLGKRVEHLVDPSARFGRVDDAGVRILKR